MKQKIGLVLGIAVSLILISVGLSFSQESVMPEGGTISEAPTEADTQWLWGEVASMDTQKNELVVKYLDYETDQEKEITITVNDKTTYENAKILSDIKPKDTVGIDYTVGAEGKNIAKNISLEKPQGAEATEEGLNPEDLKPVTNVTVE